MTPLNSMMISGKEVLPLIEGGKGVAITNGNCSGAWAAAGGVGTFSAVNADQIDENGHIIPLIYNGESRGERHEELIDYSIKGGISQARRAWDVSGGEGRIHMNVLWEMASSERVLHGVLEKTKGLVHGITCGAGMPFKLGLIAAQYETHFYPIVSSARAFRALWKRSYHKVAEWLGGMVYEDPWLAGGHNGLSNSENPEEPGDPYPRVRALREEMNTAGLHNTPIIMAGGVWYLRDWSDWIDNPELGPVCFQFGSRPLLTHESPISDIWKKRLLTLQKGEIYLNRFSPTGFYSSAVDNHYIQNLKARSKRQIPFSVEPTVDHTEPFMVGTRGKPVYLTPEELDFAHQWISQGFKHPLKTPDSTVIFETDEEAAVIRKDQIDCMGCLSQCLFSNWATNDQGSTGRKSDPRSFCIQKTLQDIAHGGSTENNLMFAGHNAYNFSSDPFYTNGFIPTVKELVERIQTGD